MSEAYTREEQNNALLQSLQTKSSALKHITLNIYDNARDQDLLDNTNEAFSNMSSNLKGSMGRLTRMARQGDRISILKLSGILVGVFIVCWFVLGWIFGLVFGRSKDV